MTWTSAMALPSWACLVSWTLGPLPPPADLLPIKAMFNGSLKKLSFFLWACLEWYALTYPDKVTMVNAVTANLEGEAAEWVTGLHDKEAPELGNIVDFLVEFRARFEDETQVSGKLHRRYDPLDKEADWWRNTSRSFGE